MHNDAEHDVVCWCGEPCASSALLRAHSTAGIYHATTLSACRGRGLGKAPTLVAMQSTRRAGYADAILFAMSSGFPLYQRLGFETVATAYLFAWNGSE